MRRHVAQLTATIQTLPVKRLRQAKAIRDDDGEVLELWLAPVRSALSYATALHEIGHWKGHHRNSRNVMVRERAAWQWARKNALIWTEAMERCAAKSLAYYEASNKPGGG